VKRDLSIKTILVLGMDGIGDIILTTPALQAIKNSIPEAKIIYVVKKPANEILQNNPLVDTVLPYERKKGLEGIKENLQLIRRIRQQKPRVAIVFHPSLRRAIFGFLSGAKKRISYQYRHRIWNRLSTMVVPLNWPKGQTIEQVLYKKKKHFVDYYLELVSKLGVFPNNINCTLIVSEKDIGRTNEILGSEGVSSKDKLVVLNLDAASSSRRWPVKNFIALAKFLIKNYRVKVILTGIDRDTNFSKWILNLRDQDIINLVGKTTIMELAAVIQKAILSITGDTGPAHIAAALGKDVVVLFGPTVPQVTGPWEKGRSIFIKKDVNCSMPCYTKECRDFRCMKAISVDEVISNTKIFLKDYKK